jgi:hypothetical protein
MRQRRDEFVLTSTKTNAQKKQFGWASRRHYHTKQISKVTSFFKKYQTEHTNLCSNLFQIWPNYVQHCDRMCSTKLGNCHVLVLSLLVSIKFSSFSHYPTHYSYFTFLPIPTQCLIVLLKIKSHAR